MEETIQRADMAKILGVSERTVRRIAKQEAWTIDFATIRGGKKMAFVVKGLPKERFRQVMEYFAALASARLGPPGSPQQIGHASYHNYLEEFHREKEQERQAKEKYIGLFSQLPEARKREAEARYEILQAAAAFVKAAGRKKIQGMALFCEQYNKGCIDLPDWVLDAAEKDGKLHRATLQRWKKRHEAEFLYGLAGRYGHRAGASMLTPEQQNFIKAAIAAHPSVLVPQIVAGLEARWNGGAPPAHVVAYFVQKFRKENASVLLSIADPDAWRSRYQFAAGSASANIVRLNQIWEADATPADVMLIDGRHTVIGMIDVWSRRARLLVVPASKAQAIATLLRRSLIDWGVPEALRTDNGKDFTARHMERVLDALEIDHDLMPPFTPEAKPHIERFFHTFSHGIVELLPGFIGHNVAERKAIEARKSFAERLMKKGSIVEVQMTARQFQAVCDRWLDAVYHQDPHSGIDGMSPAEKARSWTDPIRTITDERALDVLLCPAPRDGGWRVIGKKGVAVDRRTYFTTAMAGHEGDRVQVLQDYSDLGRVYLFEESGAYLCTATDPDWYGISAQDEAVYLKQKQKHLIAEKRRELKALVKEQNIRAVPEEILSYRESLIANVAEMPKASVPYTTEAIEEALRAADERDGVTNREALAGPLPVPPEVVACEERERRKIVNLQEKRRDKRYFDDTWDIYSWILDQRKEKTATDAQKLWQKEFEDWQDAGMKGRFQSSVSLEELRQEAISETGAER